MTLSQDKLGVLATKCSVVMLNIKCTICRALFECDHKIMRFYQFCNSRKIAWLFSNRSVFWPVSSN